MTEEQITTFWVWMLIAFIFGEAVGMIVCSICAGWYDKIVEKMNKINKKKGR